MVGVTGATLPADITPNNEHVLSNPKIVTDVSVEKSMIEENVVAKKWMSISGSHDGENIDRAVGG